MSEIQVNTVRPVSGTTLTVAGGTTVEITGAGLLQTPEVQGTNLVIDGTGQLELQRSGAQRVLINASGTTVTGNLTVSGGGVITGDGSGLTGLVGVGVGGSSSTGNLQLISNSGGANGARDIIFLDNNSEKARLYGATGNLAVDTDTLFVDATNNRVGIGKTTPASTLDVNGTCTATSFVGPVTGNVTGNVVATNLTGTIQTAAQPNITSTGALTVPSISVTGNITGSTVGALAASLLPGGCVLQIIHAQTTTEKILSTSFAATNLVGSITPKRSNSRIVVFTINHCYTGNSGGAAQSLTFKIVRTVGGVSTDVGSQFPYCLYTRASTISELIAHAIVVVDDSARPASTATHTYTVHAYSAYTDPGSGGYPVARHTYQASPSTMLLIEVAV